ncbi:MAG: hypothetical protein A2161_16895 [Candidatus Schekmanbacteria bacterium RBG_13_48_7]|uniref:Uncharacterized protein n=1 Tax=Candidatus Schekmanbacteria bacterium RBG_13_48_7 TaxID=1817878 RepID=A0A1F7RX55_9BACT|nr:MAG: hypothetical protein A2161_16895 [Candidatus Schekmanbacteria bacterium RBG_13_48_7]
MKAEGNFHLSMCPADTVAEDSRFDIEDLLAADDIIQITVGAKIEENTTATGGKIVFEIPFGEFEYLKPGKYVYHSPKHAIQEASMILDFGDCSFKVDLKNINLHGLLFTDLSFILEIGRHRGFEYIELEPDASGDHWKFIMKPPNLCCIEDESID